MGDVTLKAAPDLAAAPAFGDASGEAVAGGLVIAAAGRGDGVQGAAELAVAVTLLGEEPQYEGRDDGATVDRLQLINRLTKGSAAWRAERVVGVTAPIRSSPSVT